MFKGHYDNWTISRMNCIKKYIPVEYFKSKKILELGSGYAHVAIKFIELGAIVDCSDARKEHIEYINKTYPDIKTLIIDADNDIITDKYDIILHWGLLYHLNNIEFHLENVSKNCNILLLESEVCDSNDSDLCISIYEYGDDQSFNNKGSRPSEKYVEKILEKNGFKFKIIKDSILNTDYPHIYDWEITNNKEFKSGMRRFWICWKNIDSPLHQ